MKRKRLPGYANRLTSAGGRRIFLAKTGGVLVGRWFVVHPSEYTYFVPEPEWTVTHRASGMKIGGWYPDRAHAVKAAVAFSQMRLPWSGCARMINRSRTARQRAAMAVVMRALTHGAMPC